MRSGRATGPDGLRYCYLDYTMLLTEGSNEEMGKREREAIQKTGMKKARNNPGYGAPNVIRTHDTRFRKPLLYPAELWTHGLPI